MQENRDNTVPEEPETQPAGVRKELHQDNIEKTGNARTAADAGAEQDSSFGAVEDDMSGASDMQPVTPPMDGPDNLISGDDDDSADVDPQQEILGG